jgi:hypothetical protein
VSRGRCDASIQRWDIVGVDRVSVSGDLGQRLQSKGESQVIGSQAVISLGQSLEQSAQVNIDFSRPLNATADGLKGFVERGGQRVLQIRRESTADKLILD